jgi:chloramphenicol-sensitive protein RarD
MESSVLTKDGNLGAVSEARRGVAYGVAAYGLWGLFPLYWPLLKPAGALEILAHRMVWSLAVVLAILAATRNWIWFRALTRRRLALLTVAALLITGNWGTYIWAVNNAHVVETSLGYFINPLVSVALGVLVLGERLRPLQWVAIGIGAAAVLALAVDYGRPPWIALVLAVSFGFYGLVKKMAGVGAVEALSVETGVMFVPALAFLLVLQASGDATFGAAGGLHAALLAGAGVVTAIPLLCFGAAANRVPLSTIGLLQYLAPVLQFLIGVLVMGEAMPASRLAGFALVWLALVLLSYDGLRTHRRSARARRLAEVPA